MRERLIGASMFAALLLSVGCDKPTELKANDATPVVANDEDKAAKTDQATTLSATPEEIIVYDKARAEGLTGVLSRSCDEAKLKEEGFAQAGGVVSSLSASEQGLQLGIRHSGGCQTHRYRVCWDGGVAESDPGQTRVTFWHQSNGDMCQMMFEGKIVIKDDELRSLSVGVTGSPANATIYPE